MYVCVEVCVGVGETNKWEGKYERVYVIADFSEKSGAARARWFRPFVGFYSAGAWRRRT